MRGRSENLRIGPFNFLQGRDRGVEMPGREPADPVDPFQLGDDLLVFRQPGEDGFKRDSKGHGFPPFVAQPPVIGPPVS